MRYVVKKYSSLLAIVALAGALLANIAMTQPKAAATQLNWKPIALLNGWEKYSVSGFNVGDPEIAFDTNTSLIYLRGGVDGFHASGPVIFRLPPTYRTTRDVYVSTTLANVKTGRLKITTDGIVTVETTSGVSTDATAFTSLEGIVFPR